jgi:hypothetical protein
MIVDILRLRVPLATTQKRVLDSIAAHLVGAGFKKRAGQVFTIEVAPEVLGWLGLNRASKHHPTDVFEVGPIVGVRFQDIERSVADLQGQKFHPYHPPTVCTPLGYVMPERRYRSWLFRPSGNDEVTEEMVDTIVNYGLAFMRSTTDLAELCRKLEARMGWDHQIMYRHPVALLVAGRPQEANALIERSLINLRDRDDPAAEEFRTFAEKVQSGISPP